MAVLATTDDVFDLLQDSSLSDAYVNSILTTVDRILTKVFEYYTGTIGTGLLTEIQKYYAAHIISLTTLRMGAEEQVGEARIKYTGKWGTGFEATPYGQILLAIDPSGLISKTAMKAASIYAVKSFD